MIKAMCLVEIDVICLQTAQRPLARFHDVFTREPAVILTCSDWPVSLRKEFVGFALNALERHSQNYFGFCTGIDICCVKGGNSEIDDCAERQACL
jgi:hypothetical protein